MSDTSVPMSTNGIDSLRGAMGRIALGATVLLGLLLVGEVLRRIPYRSGVGELLQFLAALMATIPWTLRSIAAATQPAAERFSLGLVGLSIGGAIATGEYAAAVLVPLVVDLGHWLEDSLMARFAAPHRHDLGLVSGVTRRITQGVVETVDIHHIQVGDRIRIFPGEIVPVDGTIVSGVSSIDDACLTGEPFPTDRPPGSRVLAGSANLSGVIDIAADQVGQQVAMAQVIDCVNNVFKAQSSGVSNLEHISQVAITLLCVASVAVFLATRDPLRVVAMLVASCPCALALVEPSAKIATVLWAARRGVLIKNCNGFQQLADIDTVIFDKTGTLTQGRMQVADVVSYHALSRAEVIHDALLCAAGSRHPICQAICNEFGTQLNVSFETIERSETPGAGVEAHVDGHILRLGSPDWVRAMGTTIDPLPAHAGPLVAVSHNQQFAGYILFSDPVRHEAKGVIESLRELGVKNFAILTGDRSQAAQSVSLAVSISETVAEALPIDKMNYVISQAATGKRIAFVGDGVNDAPALAAANVGIHLSDGSQVVSSATADIVVFPRELNLLCDLVRLSRRYRRVFYSGVAVASLSSLSLMSLAAVGVVAPIGVALFHHLGTLFVLINACRLRLEKPSHASPLALSKPQLATTAISL